MKTGGSKITRGRTRNFRQRVFYCMMPCQPFFISTHQLASRVIDTPSLRSILFFIA